MMLSLWLTLALAPQVSAGPLSGCFLNKNAEDHEVRYNNQFFANRQYCDDFKHNRFDPNSHPSTYDDIDACPAKGYSGEACVATAHYSTTMVDDDHLIMIYFPDDRATRPFVLTVHGGNFAQNERTEGVNMSSMGIVAQRFTKHGFIAGSPEYRRDGGGRVAGTDDHAAEVNAITDIQSSFDYVRSEASGHGVDLARTCMFGMSAGGNAILRLNYETNSAWTTTGNVKAVVSYSSTLSTKMACCTTVFGAFDSCYFYLHPHICYDPHSGMEWGQWLNYCGPAHCHDMMSDRTSWVRTKASPAPLGAFHGHEDCIYPEDPSHNELVSNFCGNPNRGSTTVISVSVENGMHADIHELESLSNTYFGTLMHFLVDQLSLTNECVGGIALDFTTPSDPCGHRRLNEDVFV
jgi:acetyl esterase/lipase